MSSSSNHLGRFCLNKFLNVFFSLSFLPRQCLSPHSDHLVFSPILYISSIMSDGFNISQGSKLIDKWELAKCKHFTHIASCIPSSLASLIFNILLPQCCTLLFPAFFPTGSIKIYKKRARMCLDWDGSCTHLTEGHLSQCRGGKQESHSALQPQNAGEGGNNKCIQPL